MILSLNVLLLQNVMGKKKNIILCLNLWIKIIFKKGSYIIKEPFLYNCPAKFI